jgi:hypothetical protein
VVLLVVIGIFIAGFALYFWAYGYDDNGKPQFSGCAGLGALTVVAIVGAVGLIVALVIGFVGAAVLGN